MRLSGCGEKSDLEREEEPRSDDITPDENGPSGASDTAVEATVCEAVSPKPVVVRKFAQDLIVTACGALASAIMAILLYQESGPAAGPMGL